MTEATLSSSKRRSGVITAGLALFSMFFGAGDLIWPLILGGTAGSQNFFAMTGLLITGVTLPLLGLLAMMLFHGDYRSFFRRLGAFPGWILIFIIQAILGPIGSIPRLISLSYSTLKPYVPCSLVTFSIIASCVLLLFTMKKRRVIDILGAVLTPMLLLSLGAILVIGFLHPPAAVQVATSSGEAFGYGLRVGYNTLDLIASFIFAPLVLSHFLQKGEDKESPTVQKQAFRRMLKACLLAALLLGLMYIGLTYVASFYTPILRAHDSSERLAEIAFHLLGPYGAFFSCIAVAMACLTTAIPLVAITADYIQKDLLRNKAGEIIPLLITLVLSGLIANLGFGGIADMLSPVLQILCPGLIVLCILNICYKLYRLQWNTVPVYVAFALSGGLYAWNHSPTLHTWITHLAA